MAIQLQQLPDKVKESIENLTTLMEIGTGSDTQDEFITYAVKAIAWLLDEATLQPAIETMAISKCNNEICIHHHLGFCVSSSIKCVKYGEITIMS